MEGFWSGFAAHATASTAPPPASTGSALAVARTRARLSGVTHLLICERIIPPFRRLPMSTRRLVARLYVPLLLAACSHAAIRSDEVAGAIESDDSVMKHPCQTLTVDDFGWRLDSLGSVRFRVYPPLKSVEARTFLQRHYAANDRQLYMEMDMAAVSSDMRPFAAGLTAALRAECSVNDRFASVIVGRRDFDYETTVLFHDVGDGSQLRVTARARTLGDLQRLRATLFTMAFPKGA